MLPAGTAHSCLESSPDYQYIGVYPKVSRVGARDIWCVALTDRRAVRDGGMRRGRGRPLSLSIRFKMSRCQRMIPPTEQEGH